MRFGIGARAGSFSDCLSGAQAARHGTGRCFDRAASYSPPALLSLVQPCLETGNLPLGMLRNKLFLDQGQTEVAPSRDKKTSVATCYLMYLHFTPYAGPLLFLSLPPADIYRDR